MERDLYEEDHEMFREVAVELNSRDVAPHHQQWGHLLPTVAGNCTAVTATSRNVLSPRPTWPHACSRSSAAAVRPCAMPLARIAN